MQRFYVKCASERVAQHHEDEKCDFNQDEVLKNGNECEVSGRCKLTSNSVESKPDSLPKMLPPEAKAPDRREYSDSFIVFRKCRNKTK